MRGTRPFPPTVFEDPYPEEGLQWTRGDLTPPVTYMYQNGEKVALAWAEEVATVSEPITGEPITGEVSTSPAVTREFLASSDAYIYSSGSSYPPSGGPARVTTSSSIYVARSYNSSSSNPYTVNVGLLKFDTSALPDSAVIQSAVLRIYATTVKRANNRNFRGEWYAWDGTNTDYVLDGSTGITAFDISMSGLVIATNDIPLSNLVVNTTGDTFLRLHITGGVPSNTNYILFAATRDTSYPEATLVVTYT